MKLDNHFLYHLYFSGLLVRYYKFLAWAIFGDASLIWITSVDIGIAPALFSLRPNQYKRLPGQGWDAGRFRLIPRQLIRAGNFDTPAPLDFASRTKIFYADFPIQPVAMCTFFAAASAAYAGHCARFSPACSYAEVRDDLIGETCLPTIALRCRLSFFGASKFDPKPDRWTRITLFQWLPHRG